MQKPTFVAAGVVGAMLFGLLATSPATAQTTTTRETRTFEVLSVEGNTLVVRENTGTHEYTVPDDFRFIVDGKPLGVRDLYPGMKGTATITTRVTTKPIYVTEVRNAEVIQASGASVLVRADDGFHMYSPGDVEKQGIKIYKDGKRVEMGDLRRGDKLTATIVHERPGQPMTEQQVQATLTSTADAIGAAAGSAATAAANAASAAAGAAKDAAASAATAMNEAAAQAAAAQAEAANAQSRSTLLWAGGLIIIALVAYLVFRSSR